METSPILAPFRRSVPGRTALAAALCAALLAACSTMTDVRERGHAERIGQRLEAAGFRAVPADTPEKKAHLEQMPKLLFASVVRNGKRRWVLADPYHCDCLYVGDQAAYNRYTQMEIGQEVAESQKADKRESIDASAQDREQEFLGPYNTQAVFGDQDEL